LESIFSDIKYRRILLHISFWVSVVAFNTFIFGISSGGYDWVFKATITILPFELAATYLTLYLFIPNYLFQKKYIHFILYSFFTAVVFVTILRFVYAYALIPLVGEAYRQERMELLLRENYFKGMFWNFSYFNLYVEMYSVVGIASATKLFKYWLNNQRIKQELEKQNLKSEIALLQSQINPHFLFNTLNNIDYLVNDNYNAKASDAIVQLSEIMRYMLHESKEKKVPLVKEIAYLTSYIDLQKLRLNEDDFVSFKIAGDPRSKKISPMLFISFIENAFKHGRKTGRTPGIIIMITIDDKIKFECTNYIAKKKINKDKTSGIGLFNVKRRLELLYPGKHMLDISQDSEFYKVILILSE